MDRPVAIHPTATKMAKKSSDDPRSFSMNRTARETSQATRRGARYFGSGSRNGPRRRVAEASNSLRDDRYDARKITRSTLAISDGWKVKAPSPLPKRSH